MLGSHWAYAKKKGIDLQDFKRNTERFLQLWEKLKKD
jgi:hypothetical protein